LHAPGPLHRDASFTPAAYFEPLLPPLDEPPVEPPMLEPLLPVEPPDEPPVVLVSLLPDEPLMPEALLPDEPLEPAPLPLELPLLCANAEPASIAAETSITIDNFFILCSLISCQ
jgi:hypothetical protein